MRELSLNVLDIAQNSITAGASLIEILLEEDTSRDFLHIAVKDNGSGMNAQQVEKVTDPFYTTRTTRSVGLGIPLFKMAAEMAGGSFGIRSQVGRGTSLEAIFQRSHIDCVPVGDMCATIVALISMNTDRDFIYTRRFNGKSFTLDTKELREMLDDVPLSAQEVVEWMTAYMEEQTQMILGGADK